jgi:hypothetical protein
MATSKKEEVVEEKEPEKTEHEKDLDGRPVSVSFKMAEAYRHWAAGPKLIKLNNGEEVKANPGDWVVTFTYYKDVEPKMRQEVKCVYPFTNDDFEALFGRKEPVPVEKEEVLEPKTEPKK